MDLDDDVCLCFRVSKRKIRNFIRIEQPKRVGMISECFGAGTGCGWCRGYLKKMFEQYSESPPAPLYGHAEQEADGAKASYLSEIDEMSAEEYAKMRKQYVSEGKGEPPTTPPKSNG